LTAQTAALYLWSIIRSALLREGNFEQWDAAFPRLIARFMQACAAGHFEAPRPSWQQSDWSTFCICPLPLLHHLTQRFLLLCNGWRGTLLGSVATGIAVLAVAFVGFGLLGERLNWRTGAVVVMGVFILFGAPMIAQKLMLLARDGEASASEQVAATPIPPSPQVPSNAPVYDPYARAAVPR
jgi:hypothetical protein